MQFAAILAGGQCFSRHWIEDGIPSWQRERAVPLTLPFLFGAGKIIIFKSINTVL